MVAENFFRLRAIPQDLLAFDVLLHGGSLLALFLLYRERWWRMFVCFFRRDAEACRLLVLLFLATVPGALAGFFLREFIVTEFRSVQSVALALAVSGVILILADRFPTRGSFRSLSFLSALFIGVAQACALVPGLSRSGLTMSAARAAGLPREDAVDFSFLLALPIITGAVVLTLRDVLAGTVTLPPLWISLAGFLSSMVVSACAIGFLRRWARSRNFGWFALYLLPLAIFLLAREFRMGELWDIGHVRLWVVQYGAIIVFLLALIEVLPPLSFLAPGVLGLVVAGALIASLRTAVLFAFAAGGGIVLGNMLFFLLGKYYGRRCAACLRIPENKLCIADAFMARFGTISVFCGQFVGAIRPLIAFVAGTMHMPRTTFYPWMIGGAAAFSVVLLGVGFLMRTQLEWVLSIVGGVGMFLLLCAILAAWLMERKIRRQSAVCESRE